MAQNTRTGDLTSGPMLQKIILFSLPLAASSILQLLFNAADIVVVGRWAGDNSLAAVGSNTALIGLLTNLFVGLAVGANTLAAKYYGARDRDALHRVVHTSILLSIISGLVLTVVGVFGARTILIWMQTPENVLDLATLYLRIYFLGMTATMVYNFGAALLRAIGLHTIYVLISVVIGFAAGLVFGILLSRIPRWLSGIIIPILSIFQTIPGLVFIGVLFIWWGNIYPTVIVALSVYAMFPVLKNTYTGILEVEPKYIEAAKGCGMSSFQTLVRVELPLAMPVIISGLRMVAIYTVSWAVLASMIGLGGLGDFVYRGTSSNNNTLILLGAIPAAILAVLFGLVIDLLQKRVTPRGLRKEAGK